MKTLLLKVVVLLAPFAALSVPTFVHTLVVMTRAEQSLALREGVFDQQMEGKFLALMRDDTAVIIAGDSRAERQVVPAVVEASTGWRAANVATNGGDMVTVANAVKRHGVPPAGRVLIISASLFQVNDGAIDPGYISTACLLNMTALERVSIYADRLGSPWSPLDFKFVEGPPAALTGARLREHGFLGIDTNLSLPLPKVLLNSHPWYRSVSLHGARWRIFKEALGRLTAFGLRTYIFQPPVSPAWRAYTAGTFVDKAEQEFADMLRVETMEYANVRFLDFYSTPDARLGNDKFYDIQHLNRVGAEQFTEILMAQVSGDVRADRKAPPMKLSE
ncbi:MAG: hypothetical protein EXQ55_03060 [Acidobacteria bacterium]|nr:hypothetical protein [Acidobacteriota bacterium]